MERNEDLSLKKQIKFCNGRRHEDLKRQRMHDDTSTIESNMAEINDTDGSPVEKQCHMI